MKITLNGQSHETVAPTLSVLLEELKLAHACVATAVNGVFAPVSQRMHTALREGDAIEIVAPMQGG